MWFAVQNIAKEIDWELKQVPDAPFSKRTSAADLRHPSCTAGKIFAAFEFVEHLFDGLCVPQQMAKRISTTLTVMFV